MFKKYTNLIFACSNKTQYPNTCSLSLLGETRNT